ncbi:tyrosine-type recombinase/integrase [Bergeyella zoohelcum]|uniref:tyrosine-type recombinase/integrase n=1 Tax=Bergeyella zoohelcum TaxID=1015 RepID=UPI003736EBA9
MAKIRFILRGSKSEKHIYFRYRPSRSVDLKIKTPYLISLENWDAENECFRTDKITKGAKSVEVKKRNTEILQFNEALHSLKSKVSKLINDNLHLSSEDLKKTLNQFILKNYFGHKAEERKRYTIPEKLISIIDFYIDFRSVRDATQDRQPLAENTIKKLKGLQRILTAFDKDLKISDINNLFRGRLVKWLDAEMKYSEQHQAKILKDIKTLCLFAETEHAISPDVKRWKIKSSLEIENASKGLYFTFEQVKVLHRLDLSQNERLDNARDWLLISIYTAVRVSELMKMRRDDITQDHKGRAIIKVIEDKNRNKKSRGLKYLPLLDEVQTILQKRGGDFPRAISSQKYNQYIKEVCKIAGFTEMVESATIQRTDKGNRKIKGVYPFYQLVTSHIGRQTFVTLFSEYLPLEVVQMMTNHQSEKMTLHYNKTDFDTQQKKKAETVANAFNDIDYKTILKVV